MANRKQLSWESRDRIEQQINELGGDEALSIEATKLVLRKYKKSIEQNGLSITYTQETLIKNGILDEKSLSKVLRSSIYQHCLRQQTKISYAELEELINNQDIVGKGISAGTCKRFKLGEKIDGKAFDILCETLEVNPEDVCQKKPSIRPISNQEEELNIALCRFNYQQEEMSFRQRQGSYHSLYLHKKIANEYSCHWLLKSLIINQSELCNHRIIPLYPVSITSPKNKSKSRHKYSYKEQIEQDLLNQIIKDIKKLKSQFNFKITNNSRRDEVAEALQKILQKQSIIFLVQSLDDIGIEIGKAVIEQLWNQLTPNLTSTSHHLFLCFVGATNIQSQSIGCDISFTVGNGFTRGNLNTWFNNSQNNKLFNELKTPHDITAEVNRIWQRCRKGENDLLLEEIHSSCHCQIEETLWKKI